MILDFMASARELDQGCVFLENANAIILVPAIVETMSSPAKVVYSTKEKALLASLVEIHKNQLENKKTDGSSISAKNESWAKVTEQFNSHDVAKRTTAQLKKCWENMKYKTRKSDTKNRFNMLLTGGGPPVIEPNNPLDEMVRSIVPDISFVITNNWDSTGTVEQSQAKCEVEEKAKDSEPLHVSGIQKNTQLNEESQENIPSCSYSTLHKEQDTGVTLNKTQKCLKRKRLEFVDEEKALRVEKIRQSIQQQKEFHEARMEAVELEKDFWRKKIHLLN